jgi:Ca2+-binding RTX toxin-like protein
MLAGGAGADSVFGQLGNDILQGDGNITLNLSANSPSVSAPTDGDDYMEGGGGNDLMFGNGGQDDLIGGSSSLFGLTSPNQRPDGSDTIFGDSGTDVARNTPGDTTTGGHARNADAIIGDNGNIYRILNAAKTGFVTFNYDDYAGTLRIIPRAFDLLDYSADDNAANDIGAGDVIHGESGDDSIHGASGNDTIFGEGQDDDLLGETGDDWISGGSGNDGILGDDGKILTSRNGKAEPLYGIAATTQSTFSQKSIDASAVINPTGALSKGVDLEPFDHGGNDLIYGGLGNDSIHGGAGQDAISGAEALANFYSNPAPAGLVFDNAAGKFTLFDYFNPLAKIANHPLNFEATVNGQFVNDGDDKLFGDSGNDWLVGGTDKDNLWGGMGNDILNVDDNLDTTTPDSGQYEGADLAFGGGGRDILIGNAKSDRLVDWVGEFNNYYVPFNPFGQSTVIRQISQSLPEFLYAVSKSDGADQTRVGVGLGSASRNGEPFGELGLVLQSDKEWKDQNGPPVGPQPQ